MIAYIKSKVLFILVIFCAIAVIRVAGDNFLFSTITLIVVFLCMIFLKNKEIKKSLPTEIRGRMSKAGTFSILWGTLFFIAPSYYLYEEYLFAYKSSNHMVTVSKSTEMVCSYGKRKSSTKSESPCWNIEYQIDGKIFERRMHVPTLKGDKFSVVYVKSWDNAIRYENAIEDRDSYFLNQISILQSFFYILSLYKIFTGFMMIRYSKLAKGSLISDLGIVSKVIEKKDNERIEPTL